MALDSGPFYTAFLHGHADCTDMPTGSSFSPTLKLGIRTSGWVASFVSQAASVSTAREMHSGSGSQATDWGMSKLWRVHQQPSQAPHPTVPQGIASLGQDAISCTPQNADWGTRAEEYPGRDLQSGWDVDGAISSELPWKQIENQNAVLCAVGSWEVAGLVALGLYRFKMYKLYMIMR